MIKNCAIRRILITSFSILTVVLVYNFPNDQTISYKVETNYIEATKMPVYLLDENQYVSRISILKNSEDIIENVKYIIKTLTVGSVESEYVSAFFYPILPEGTELIKITIENRIAKLNFSKEFLNIEEDKEVKLIEALIYSLCEFEEIDQIMIFIEEDHLTNLPHSNKNLPLTLDKSYGINKVYDINSIKNTISTTSYYLSSMGTENYYIPITKFENNQTEKIEIIIKNLQTSPINQTNLISYLKASATLEYYEILEESILLSFDNNLIADLSDQTILEEVRYSIYLSIRDTYDIEQVIFDSNNEISVTIFN